MNLRSKIITTAAVVTLLAAGSITAIGTASAQTPSETPEAAQAHRKQVRESFLNKLAANLNVSMDQLKAAFKSAELSTVDDLVADGTLTADQGAKAKDKINSGDGLGLGRFLGQHRAARHGDRLQRIRAGLIKSAAKAIGIDAKALATDLRGGSSIADVAGQHGVSVDAVKAQITDDAKAALDKAVANGKLTQEKEDAALQKLAAKLDDILNKKKS